MHPNQPSKRRRRQAQINAEALETRQLLTGGAGNTFAIVPGEITTAGQPAAIKFTIDSSHFTVPKGRLTLGIDAVAQTSSTAKPSITTVKDSGGKIVADTVHSVYDKKVLQTQTTSGIGATAVLSTVRTKAGSNGQSYTVNVTGASNTTGKMLLGFYLPGDANGDGTVNKADIKAIKSALNARAGDTKYSFDADANRDGRIGINDLQVAQKNMGVKTTITPIVSANLDDTANESLKNRVTMTPDVKFTGVASPGASIKFEETGGKIAPITVQADTAGNYSLNAALAEGANTFKITTVDAFGQSIQGTIAPVTYSTNKPVTPETLVPITAQTETKS